MSRNIKHKTNNLGSNHPTSKQKNDEPKNFIDLNLVSENYICQSPYDSHESE